MIPKLIFLDLDGTIIRKNKEISPRVLEALHKVKGLGTKIAFATGRSAFSAQHLFPLVKPNAPCSFYSAALIYDPVGMKPIRQWNLEKAAMKEFISDAKMKGFYLELYTDSNYYIEAVTPMTEIHNYYIPMPPEVAAFETVIDRNDIIKICFSAMRGEEETRLRNFISKYPQFHYGIATGAAHDQVIFCNATNPEATREKVFEVIRTDLGLDASEIMAFGDGESDRVFIEKAGVGVAMGNAPDVVKRSADFVTLHVEEDGVAHALETLVFGQLDL